MTTPGNISRALADLRDEIGELARGLTELNKAMALGGPNIYPSTGGIFLTPRRPAPYHCTHCMHKTTDGVTLPCTENDCTCILDHSRTCGCHGNYQKWCDDHDVWDWVRGLTNRSTPFILTRVIA